MPPSKRQLEVIARCVKETATHFKEYGWDLDYNILIESVVYDLLGFHPSERFITGLAKKVPIEVRFELENRSMVRTRPDLPRGTLKFVAVKQGKTNAKRRKTKRKLHKKRT